MSIENKIAENPPHLTFPSENFVKKGTTGSADPATDVYSADLFSMLSVALRQADQAGDDVLSRLLQRPGQVADVIQQKAWKLSKLIDPSAVPEALLQHLRTIVGFGEHTGLPDRIYDRLDPETARKLIQLAVPFWLRRGRRDALEDLIYTLTGVRPLILDWFTLRNLLDECFVGMGVPVLESNDVIIGVIGDVTGNDVDGDTQVHIRIPDVDKINNPIDRTLVKDMIKLARPMCERYEIGFVDFLDTMVDKRLGHWRTVKGLVPEWTGADQSIATNDEDPMNPKRWLPRLDLQGRPNGLSDIIAAETPRSSSWTEYSWSVAICQQDNTTPIVLYVYADPSVEVSGGIKGYAVSLWPNIGPGLVGVTRRDENGTTPIVFTFADIQVNKAMWRPIFVGLFQGVDNMGAYTQITVGADGALLATGRDYSGDRLTSGTVAVSAELTTTGTIGLGPTELFEDPITVETVLPSL